MSREEDTLQKQSKAMGKFFARLRCAKFEAEVRTG
jgi:hypothetical protein